MPRFTYSRLLSILILSLLSTVAAAQSNGLFNFISLNSTGAAPVAIATGDFNGDGRIDLAVVNDAGNSVSILIGNGDGNFQPAVNYSVGTTPVAVATGDFNHDGHLDLAVVNSNPNTGGAGGSLSILFGRGDGTFAAGATYGLGALPAAVAAGDFDGDGNLDLAVVIGNPNVVFNPGFVTVLLGKADGTFVAQANYNVGIVPVSIAAGDFNGDGKLDLAVGSNISGFSLDAHSEVSMLMNNGSGGFVSGSSFTVGQLGTIPILITPADFNNDGKLDLAVAIDGTSNVLICQGNGDGTFTPLSAPAVGTNPLWVSAADFNGDGKIDLVTANDADGTIAVLLGNGDETFASPVVYAVGKGPAGLAIADLNGDGRSDVIVANNADSTVQVLAGRGDGTLRAGTYPVAANPSSIATGDFNSDGIPDLAIISASSVPGQNGGTLTILTGDGRGGFRSLAPLGVCPAYTFGSMIAGPIVSADLNGDGKADLVFACATITQSQESVFFLTGNGDGTFTSAGEIDNSVFGAPTLALADINGDGVADIAGSFGSVGAWETLGGALSIVVDLESPIQAIRAGDFNGDGKTDLLFVTTTGSVLLLGDGTGSFQTFNVPGTGDSAQVGDFNGDGFTDYGEQLVNIGQPFAVQLSNGDGTFRSGFTFDCCIGAASSIADFNGDGMQDILSLPGTFSSNISVSLGQLDGSFADSGTSVPATGFTNISANGLSAVADFDGDGSPDAAVLLPGSNNVMILLNKKTFQPTNVALAASSVNLIVGQPVTFTAVVSSNQGLPTGNVVFKQAGAVQATAALSAGSSQVTITPPATIGSYSYTALYTGDGSFSGSLSKRLLLNVSPAFTTTTIASSGNNSKLGQSVTFTATVKPQFSGTPTGTVQFYADGQPIGVATVNNGQASVGVTSLSQGTHTIESDYEGDSNFTASFAVLKQKVGKAVSTVTVTSSLNPAAYGQPVALTATVSDSEGVPPTGFVVFSEGATIYGSVTLNAGLAQLTLTQLLVGKHNITAQYGGDGADNSANAIFTQTIQGAATTTSVSSDLDPSSFGQSVTFTATVTSSIGTPDGTVTFKQGSQALATVSLASGQAQFSTNTLGTGADSITAAYSGSSAYAKSQGSVSQIVIVAATTLALQATPNPATAGQAVTLTASVSAATGVIPTGTVTFKDGKAALGTVAVVNGVAQLSTTSLATGAHNITASFNGKPNFAASTGGPVTETID